MKPLTAQWLSLPQRKYILALLGSLEGTRKSAYADKKNYNVLYLPNNFKDILNRIQVNTPGWS